MDERCCVCGQAGERAGERGGFINPVDGGWESGEPVCEGCVERAELEQTERSLQNWGR